MHWHEVCNGVLAKLYKHYTKATMLDVHYPGELAYLDCFSGLVPCKVLSIYSGGQPTIRITATRGAYKKGEVLTPEYSRDVPCHVVPRANVRKFGGVLKIIGGYVWREAK